MLRLLQITAHPDDECLWAGGILAMLAEAGVDVTALCCSPERVSLEGDLDARVKEFHEACRTLGIRGDVHTGNIGDIRSYFRAYQIQDWPVILTHSSLGELNQHREHKWVHWEVKNYLAECGWKGLLLTFGIGIDPSVLVPLSDAHMAKKAAAVAAHKSQAPYVRKALHGVTQRVESLHLDTIKRMSDEV